MSDGNSHFLSQLGRAGDDGSVVETLDDLLSDVVEGVYMTGKAGHVNLKMKIKPNAQGFEVEWETTSKVPAREHGKSFAWKDADNRLTRTPPGDEMQRTMGTVIEGGMGGNG